VTTLGAFPRNLFFPSIVGATVGSLKGAVEGTRLEAPAFVATSLPSRVKIKILFFAFATVWGASPSVTADRPLFSVILSRRG